MHRVAWNVFVTHLLLILVGQLFWIQSRNTPCYTCFPSFPGQDPIPSRRAALCKKQNLCVCVPFNITDLQYFTGKTQLQCHARASVFAPPSWTISPPCIFRQSRCMYSPTCCAVSCHVSRCLRHCLGRGLRSLGMFSPSSSDLQPGSPLKSMNGC